MARKLHPDEERDFLEVLAQSIQSGRDESVASMAGLRGKEDAPIPISTELAAWLIEQQRDRFPF